ncbi:FadR/GntR family transcriptional regulator [Citricoccus alkalitolerans]|uniref:FadR/GntR family transcriptional regulator n=1 Tax=Citricoccus alkalitolerans TaxID=246603 RepID=A0ABV8XWM9_9MICC
MAQVKRTTLTDQAADLLLARIRSGEWPVGTRLPGETTLAPQLGVGRSTIREALRQLAGRGVLESQQGAGVFVTALDAPEDWDLVLRRADIASVLEARLAIEAEAAALAAARRTPSDLRTIRRAYASRLTEGQGIIEHVEADMAVHRAIVAASHNNVLLELFDGFVPRVRQAMIDMMRIQPVASPEEDHAAHAVVIDAIAHRRAEEAARASRTHINGVKETLA